MVLSRRLIVNADDLGLCRGVNEGILRAHREGILTSASLMATGPCFEHAVSHVIRENPDLGIGAHLCLTSGKSVLGHRNVPALVDREGRFRHGFVSLMRLVRKGGVEVVRQIAREWDAQLARIESAGVDIDHLDSHRHIHMIPPVFDVTTRLAAEHGRCFVRYSIEPWFPQSRRTLTRRLPHLLRNLPKNVILRALASRHSDTAAVPRVDRVYGILGSGRMDRHVLQSTITRLPEGISEILTHPAVKSEEPPGGIDAGDRAFVLSPHRQCELDALTTRKTHSAIVGSGIELVTFRQSLLQMSDPSARPTTRTQDAPAVQGSSESS